MTHNKYYIVSYKKEIIPSKKNNGNIYIDIDPTSYAKLSDIMSKTLFHNVFITMDEIKDVKYVLKNLELINAKVRIVLLNQWKDKTIGESYKAITIIDSFNLVASHLYGQLPNVPLIATNIGLGEGEIMEVHIPFASSYAHRHVGSLLQKKWKIVAMYREDKLILPTNITKILPNDRILIIGNHRVLNDVYKRINKRAGLFPEPFGKNIYIILDFRFQKEMIIRHLEEAIYLLNKLEDKLLIIRVIYPNNFELLADIRKVESENIIFLVEYDENDMKRMIEYDISKYYIGLIMITIPTFTSAKLKELLFELKKIVYLFGDNNLSEIKKSVILMDNNQKMESIASTTFDFCDTLELKLILGDFDPEGDFSNRDITLEHYEELTHIFNTEVIIDKEIVNPIKQMFLMDDMIQVIPFKKNLNTNNFKKLISRKVEDFVLTTHKHPKLLIPCALEQNNTF